MAELDKLVVLLNILEPLQVKGKDERQFLHSESFGGLLLTAALLTVVLRL